MDKLALASVVGDLLVAAETGRAVSYSRNKNFYRGQQRYCGGAYTYANVTGCVRALEGAGYIENWTAPARSPREGVQGVQSRMRATPLLLEACHGLPVTRPDSRETIWLRDVDGRNVDYAETRAVDRMRKRVERINANILSIEMGLPLPGVTQEAHHLVIPHVAKTGNAVDIYIPNDALSVRRLFCRGSFQCGGRLYGSWQQIPSALRSSVTLNGEPTAEPDFSSIHPRLAYAMAGRPLAPGDDPYTTGDFPRKHGKLAVLVSLNAPTTTAAVGAIAEELGTPREYASRLLKAVKAKNPDIAHMLGTDAGVILQRRDSDIALDVIEACHRDGIHVLPVHDSFIVPAKHADRTREIMDRAWSEALISAAA
ncbi:hypothetical protein [Methylobacterium sp. GC_Met_1]|uniref:hypothetical protein n=1 Tax=Methylobacterium sp. GC_Met_1 TaxID=2937377 RepID=UPI002269BA25|nr:hypothetical protein [Methylobacterium sp. GC_Met_1]